MKLEQLKQEITQLSTLVEGWQESGYAVEIERDLALEKVRNIYNTLRFKMETEPIYPHAESGTAIVAAAATTITEEAGEQSIEPLSETEQEPDFEIEFIIPEESEDDEEVIEPLVTEEDEEEEEEDEVDDNESDNDYFDEDDEEEEEGDYNDGDEDETEDDEVEVEPAPEVTVEPTPAPQPEQEPQPEPEPEPQPAQQPQFGFEQSLFGAEPTPRTTPRRRSLLMSLYDDAPQVEKSTPEENLSESHTKPYTAPSATPSRVNEAHNAAPRATVHVEQPPVVTLADTDVEAVLGEVLIPERQTLGDTISPMQTVAESAPVKSLRSSISVVDRFMLTRTLFGGDDAAFDRAIEELDSFDDFDNCIIHITENYSWPPASEGAKMIIELLQRKFL